MKLSDTSFDANERDSETRLGARDSHVEDLMDEEELNLYEQEKLGKSDIDKRQLTKQGWIVNDDEWDETEGEDTPFDKTNQKI